MKFYYLLLLCALSFVEVKAQTWVKTQGPYGGPIRDIIVHPNGTVYALGDYPNQAIYRSSDNGNNWQELSPSVMGSNDAHRIADLTLANDGTIYALASSNLYKSQDDGATWVKVNTGANSSSGGFDSGDEFAINVLSNTFYVAGYHNSDGQPTIFRSTNSGATWTKGYQGKYFSNLVSNSLGEVYALTAGQTWKSANDGTTFTQVATPVPTDVISNANFITSKSDGSQLAIVTGSSAIYTLTAPFASAAWTAVAETNIADPTSYGFSSRLLYSADNSTLFLFDEYNNKVYARSGGNWTAALTTSFLTANGEDISCAASRDVSTLYVGSQDLGVYKSINGGVGWTEINTGIENQSMTDMVIADNNDIFTAGEYVFRSTDNGQSWSKLAIDNYKYTVIKATTGSPRTLLLFGEYGGTSYKSINNGSSWTTITNTPSADHFISPDGTKILAFTYNKLFYSGDQGVTWSPALTISGLPANPNFNVYSVGSNIAMDQNANIYAYLYDSGVGYKFYKIVPNSTTSPTTATATEIPLSSVGVTSVYDMRFMNNKVYVIGYGSSNDYISYTADFGVSWTPKVAPSAERVDLDPMTGYIFLTESNGSNYTMYLSRDQGTTFSSASIDLPSNHTQPYGVVLNTNGIAFAGFNGSSVHKTTSTVVIPSAPTALVNSGSSTDRISLQFTDNASNEQYFVVEKFNGSSYDSITYASSSYLTGGKVYVEIRNLQPNASYQFKVYAKNTAGKSPDATITTSTLGTCASGLPDNKSWNGNVNGTKTLTNVSIKLISDGVYSVSDVNNGMTTSGDAILPGTFSVGCAGAVSNTYLYSEYPIVPNGNGTWTSATNTLVLKWITESGVTPEVIGTVTLVKNANDPTPAAPTNAAAYIYSDNSIEVNWKSAAFEKTFTIERKTGAGGTYSSVGTVQYPVTSFIDPGPLTAATTYFYRIKSENGNAVPGVSPYSNEAQVTFKAPNFVLAQTNVNTTLTHTLGTIWADFNKDGFDDLLLTKFDLFTGNQSTPLIFQNDGAGNFIPASTNLDATSYANGTAADYDNDGDVDVFYSTFGDLNRLYNGNGTFTFSKISPTPLEGDNKRDFEGAPFSAAWVDYNKDGLLDLFVGRNGNFSSELYAQNSDHTFSKITTAGDLVASVMGVFGMAWADYDNDGDMDVFVIDQESGQPDKLFRNNNDGTFTKVTGSAFDAEAAMNSQSSSWADFDNDQDFDLFVGDESGLNKLFRNNGNGTFTKLTTAAFDVTTAGALGSNWIDTNNDGFIDLLVTGQEGNVLFINSNGTSFTRNVAEKISDTQLYCISASSSDYNNDGFMDLSLSRTFIGGDEGELGPAQTTLLFKNNNKTGNWLKVRLTGVTSNKSAVGAKIKATTGIINQIRQVTSHIDISSQNSLTQHFGLGSATTADLTVTWPSGIVQTLTNVTANTTVNITEDGIGPVITSRTPDLSATAVSTETTISVTLDEASVTVAGKKLNIALTSDPTTIIQSVDVANASVSGNAYTFTLPTALQASSNYTVMIDAGAFKDIYGNNFLGIASGAWTFTTADPPDLSAPVISFTNPGSLAKGFGTASPPLTVTDNKAVTSAVVHIRKISGSAYTDITATPGATTDTYTVPISEATHFDATGAEFFITASDAAGNISRDPVDPGTYKVYLTYSGSQAIIPATSIGFGGAKTGWKVFAIPFELTSGNNNVSSIFEELEGKDNRKDYRLITLKNDAEWSEYPDDFATITRGTGYFINIRTDPGAIDLFDDLQAPQNSRANLYQMNLKAGWNMVGNPYLTPISWDDVAAIQDPPLTGTEAQLKTFSAGTYSNDQMLAPYEGGFVLMSAAKTISIPFQGQTTSGGRQGVRTLGEDISAESWAVPLTIDQDEISYTLGGIGMAPDANASIDNYDDVTPPRFIDYLELNFKHPEHIARNFTREIVPTQQNYTWDFTVDSNLDGMAKLVWNNAPLITSGKDLFLLDLSTQQLTNMKETGTHRFDPKESSRFRIYYGDNLNLAPERIHLGQAYPNPTNGNTTISFSLPETGGLNQSVSLDIIDALGHTVGTVVQHKYNPGYHEASFDANGLPGGFYTYRLEVRNRAGQTVEVHKLIVK